MRLVKSNSNLIGQLSMLFDNSIKRDVFKWDNSDISESNPTIPAFNTRETAETKNDFNVEHDENVLTISSYKHSRLEDRIEEGYSQKELSFQFFKKLYTLKRYNGH